MKVVAIIPVKALSDAKSRLKPFLTDTQRRRLVKSMLRRVIRAAQKTGAEVWVLGADDSTRKLAQEEGVVWRQETGKNINESLRLVFDEVWDAGKSPLFLPGDLPFLQSEDVLELMSTSTSNPLVGAGRETSDRTDVILSPANSGGGTNAILITRQIPFQFQLGPDSFSRHLEETRKLGLEPVVHNCDGLARDLDTRQDLQEYETLHPGFLADLTRGED